MNNHNVKDKWIFFDVGGVLINDFSGNDSWDVLKRRINAVGPRNELFEEIWRNHEPIVCIDYDIDDMLSELQSHGMALNMVSLLDTFVDLFTTNRYILDLLENFKDEYDFALITNMYPRMLVKIFEKGIMPTGYSWKYIFDSSVIGMQKPDIAIFRHALEVTGADPSRSVFIDNSPRHIASARQIGLRSFLYDVTSPQRSTKKIIEELV